MDEEARRGRALAELIREVDRIHELASRMHGRRAREIESAALNIVLLAIEAGHDPDGLRAAVALTVRRMEGAQPGGAR